MIINLTLPIKDSRITRTVSGKPSSMDISELFETNAKDTFTDEPITHKNFDSDEVFYIQEIGYVRRKSLVELGYTKLIISNFNGRIYVESLK